MTAQLSLFLVCPPGLESELEKEASALGLAGVTAQQGGVACTGVWPDVWRANLWLRGATRVLVQLAHFPTPHLGALEKRAAAIDWAALLGPRQPVRLDVTCRASRIAHAQAASTRLERALRTSTIPVVKAAPLTLKARIEDNHCTISVDTSGEPLHKRGFKVAVGKAPLRETMAALLLSRAGYAPGETVIDPFCGSGTLVIEAAEIAAGLAPGRERSFAFENLPSFNPALYRRDTQSKASTDARFIGHDRDPGAIQNATANAKRAGVRCTFTQQPVAELARPDGAPGLVICNPPYGARISNDRALLALYATLGARLRENFADWRVAVLTSEPKLARAAGLDFAHQGPPIAHGGLKVRLYQATI